MYMLGTKYGFAQSTDCAAQIMDLYFARQSMDFVRNHGSRVSKGAKYKFADNPWIALRKLIAWFACRSSARINYRSQVSTTGLRYSAS